MHMRSYIDYPMRAGLITGFCYCPTEYLEYIRSDLGLFMTIETLSFIQNHYRLRENRDCDVNELILLDILFANSKERLDSERNYSIAEMVTGSKEIRETMEDLMTKLNAVAPHEKGPFSLARMFGISSDYIASVFSDRGSTHFVAKHLGEDEPALRSHLSGFRETVLCNADSFSFAISSDPIKSDIKEGIYVQIKNNGELTSFIDELLEKGISFNGWIIDENLLATVLSDTKSAEITVPGMLSEIATYGCGDILLLCRKKDEMNMVSCGMERGLQMRRAGIKNKKGKFLFKSKAMTTAVEGDFLMNFAQAKVFSPVKLKVGEEELSGNVNCKLMELSYEKSFESLSIVCASSDMSAPYRSGISQVLCAVAGEIALGASIEDIKIKTVISCPKNTDPSQIFSHILGIYRAEIELCLSSRDNELHVSDDVEKRRSVSVALGGAKAKGTFGEGRLFAVSPEENDGEICFANVRKTFSYVSALIESGHVIRACALDSEGLTDSAEEKKTFAAGSFLILTDAELSGCGGVSVSLVGMVGEENALPIV